MVSMAATQGGAGAGGSVMLKSLQLIEGRSTPRGPGAHWRRGRHQRPYCWDVVVFFAAAISAFSTSTAFSICASRPCRNSAGVLSTNTSGGTP